MNILIVEDEHATAELLKELIEQFPDCLVVNILSTVKETVAYLKLYQDRLDLMFLDIQLADALSFQIFEQLSVTTPVVFCTAYDEYMLQAFKSNGIDYILKPVEETDVSNALDKYIKLRETISKRSPDINDQIASLLAEGKTYQRSFIVYFREEMIPVPTENIALFHLHHGIVKIYCFDQKQYTISLSMEDILSRLDDQSYFRINRQMIVNRRAVIKIEPYFNRKVIVKTSPALPEKAIVSRLKVSQFMSWLEQSK